MLNKIVCFVLMFFLTPCLAFSNVLLDDDRFSVLKRVDEYIFILDTSGSMLIKEGFPEYKITAAKEIMSNIVKDVPSKLDIESSLVTICPETVVFNGKIEKTISQKHMLKKIKSVKENHDVVGRMTNLEKGIYSLDKYLKDNSARKIAMILITDGDYNRGDNPVDAVKHLYKKYNNVVFHVIDLSTKANGRNTIDEIVNLHDDSVKFNGKMHVLNGSEFAHNVAKSVIYGTFPIVNVHFNFDEYKFKDKSDKNVILDIANMVNESFLVDSVNINGWTDSIGTEKYNDSLSTKRAKTVHSVLENDIYEVIYTGNGESSMFDNKTRNGRALNRRAEIWFF